MGGFVETRFCDHFRKLKGFEQLLIQKITNDFVFLDEMQPPIILKFIVICDFVNQNTKCKALRVLIAAYCFKPFKCTFRSRGNIFYHY